MLNPNRGAVQPGIPPGALSVWADRQALHRRTGPRRPSALKIISIFELEKPDGFKWFNLKNIFFCQEEIWVRVILAGRNEVIRHSWISHLQCHPQWKTHTAKARGCVIAKMTGQGSKNGSDFHFGPDPGTVALLPTEFTWGFGCKIQSDPQSV